MPMYLKVFLVPHIERSPGVTQVNGATRDETLTAEQCINGNTETPINPAEEQELIRAVIIENKLNEIKITKKVCEGIIDRTPGSTLVERAAAADNMIQESTTLLSTATGVRYC